jgi:hypothetical protein
MDCTTMAIHRGAVDRPLVDDGSAIRPNAAGAVDAVDTGGSLSWVRQGENDQGGECGVFEHRTKSILGAAERREDFFARAAAAAVVAALVAVSRK